MLILASKSPRRRELLKMLDLEFKIMDLPGVEETYPSDLPAEKVPEFLSKIKAEAYTSYLNDEDILITADTVVIIDNEIIGKPKDLEDAKKMLSKLSGKQHRVVTGVSLTSTKKSVTFSSVTDVKFAHLSVEDIDFYVEKYKPLDKAGAYGIQEWIGAVGIEGIVGSFYNVMGLPIHALYKQLLLF